MKHRLPPRALSTEAPAKKEASPSTECISPFKDAPWEYLETEEYLARYGSRPVWANYRRNHKGGIPPQRTRKTCIRGDKVAGNPCPICRDQKLHVDYRNVKLLEQFICEHTGVIFHAPHTGVCMKQHKKLTQAIKQARDHGLLPFHVPVADLRDTDFSNQHGAVTRTPPGPALGGGTPWYPWYAWHHPSDKEVARMRRLYRGHLREESGPPPERMPQVPQSAAAPVVGDEEPRSAGAQ
ncbi:LOW QUALITY PROTEIN: 28S ribosomal protein S18b, mitochondrial [Ornithorhynchus anatinus]|uniref:LOW QUALITY PROTEIN: 28S ribosomal protein S18b, mitochondrial n=1 Tax=Ornithorhynchus anatinus TaxID=9258 RepID=UPI0010A8622E|nr:LOW QUALITY PROTEIN: 28S ribosomal protein S18b, mitochondrial [Ornithorhynchus anatinus]